MRRTLRWTHRWLGLTLGLLFAAIALSGSLLLFQAQYFRWAHGDMIPDELAQQPGSIDAWVANGRAAAPDLGQPIAIWRPHVAHNVSDAGMLVFGGREPGGLGNMGFVGVLIAPATGAVLGVFDIDRSPAYAPLFFHRDFWGGYSGRIVAGVMAVGTLAALLIGLYLWWPSNRVLRKLSPKPWRTTLSNVARLHDWVGIWTLVALLILTVSGLYLAQPGWMEPVLAVLPGEEEPEAAAGKGNCTGAIGFDAALAAARDLAPNGAWTAIYPHDQQFRTWVITFKTPGDTDADHGDTHVEADLQCGTVMLHETAETRPARNTAEVWLHGLHDGTIAGRIGEIVVTVLGVVPLVLYVTGLMSWWKKRKVRRNREASLRTQSADA